LNKKTIYISKTYIPLRYGLLISDDITEINNVLEKQKKETSKFVHIFIYSTISIDLDIPTYSISIFDNLDKQQINDDILRLKETYYNDVFHNLSS